MKDSSKLSPRKPYLITKLYEDNDEQMAILQKTDTQFRQKEYKLKLSELIPLPGQGKDPGKHDVLEEDIATHKGHEIEDEFLINNLKVEAEDLIYNIANQIMKTSFEEVYQHPIDLKRFLQEWELEDNEVTLSKSGRNDTSSITTSSRSPTSSSGSYCSTLESPGSADSDTLTDSDSSMPPPPPKHSRECQRQ